MSNELLIPQVLASLFARLCEDGGRYLLSVGLTREEFDAQEPPTFGGKGHVRWLTDEEYAALCSLWKHNAKPARIALEPECAGCGFAHAPDYKDCVWLKCP